MLIKLREVTPADGENIAKWRNSINVIKHCIDKTVISKESNQIFYEKMIVTGKYRQYIVERVDEEFGGLFAYQIGTIYFKDIDETNHKCELGMFPGEDEEWNSESQKLAVEQMLQKAWHDLSLHKVYAYVYTDCHEEVKLLEDCGFIKEGELVDEICDNSNYRNLLRLCAINAE